MHAKFSQPVNKIFKSSSNLAFLMDSAHPLSYGLMDINDSPETLKRRLQAEPTSTYHFDSQQ